MVVKTKFFEYFEVFQNGFNPEWLSNLRWIDSSRLFLYELLIRNDDADVEDFGNKWSLGALLRYLRSQGHDTTGESIL